MSASDSASPARLMVLLGLTAVLFIGGLLVTGSVGVEILGDTDFKPFFLVYLLLSLVPFGYATYAIATGAALGEAILDFVEGYAADDPFGFVGYVVGFTVYGYVLHKYGDPTNRGHMALAAVLGAFVQIIIEGVGYLAVAQKTVEFYAVNVAGNTITHGVLMGLIPLVVLYPVLHGRVERFLGYAPQGEGRATAS